MLADTNLLIICCLDVYGVGFARALLSIVQNSSIVMVCMDCFASNYALPDHTLYKATSGTKNILNLN